MNLGELEDFFIPKISKYKNLSQSLHRCQGLEDPLSSFQPIFFYCAKIQSESYCCRVGYEQREENFDKLKEVYLSNILIYNKLFNFSYKCHILGESNPSLSLFFRSQDFPVLTHVFRLQISGKWKQISKNRESFFLITN